MTLWPPTANGWKAIFRVFALIIVIGLVLFTMDRCGSYFGKKDIGKAMANVNAALQNVNAAKQTVGNDRVDEGIALQQVNAAVKDAINASTATDQAKQETNQALANYEATKNANLPTGTSEADLNEKLRALGN